MTTVGCLKVNHTALFPNATFTLEAYKWASTIVSSRSIVVSTGNVTVPLLVMQLVNWMALVTPTMTMTSTWLGLV